MTGLRVLLLSVALGLALGVGSPRSATHASTARALSFATANSRPLELNATCTATRRSPFENGEPRTRRRFPARPTENTDTLPPANLVSCLILTTMVFAVATNLPFGLKATEVV